MIRKFKKKDCRFCTWEGSDIVDGVLDEIEAMRTYDVIDPFVDYKDTALLRKSSTPAPRSHGQGGRDGYVRNKYAGIVR